MKKFNQWSFKKHFIASSIIIAVIMAVIRLLTPGREAASIGIIGGADGPTVIFISGKIGGFLTLTVVLIVFLVIMLLLYRFVKSMIEKRR